MRHLPRSCLASLVLFATPCLAADEVLTDIILLIDTSGSMREARVANGKALSFDDVKMRLGQFLYYELPNNSNITIITIGKAAERQGQVLVKDRDSRDQLWKIIEALKADAQSTHITRGLELGLEELARLRGLFPDHQRLVFLITDGRNNPAPGSPQVTFERLREAMSRRFHLKPGADFYFWYAHLGNADEELRGFARDAFGGGAQIQTVTDTWRLKRFNFNRRLIRLGVPKALPPGEFAQDYPSEEDRAAGEKLTVTGTKGVEILFGPLEIADLPAGASVEVQPRSLRLKEETQEVVLHFLGRDVPPGLYEASLPLRSSEGFVIRSPFSFRVRFQVARPVVAVTPRDVLDLGPVSPFTTARARIVLEPDEVAQELRPKVGMSLEFDEAAGGLQIGGLPAEIGLESRQVIEVTAALDRDRRTEPGPRAGQITFRSTNPHVGFGPSALPVRLEVVPARLVLEQSKFEKALGRGEDQVHVTIPLRGAAIPAGVSIKGNFGDVKGQGPALTLPSRSFEVTQERPAVTLNMMFDPMALVAAVTYTIPLAAADRLVVFEPGSIELKLLPATVLRPTPLEIREAEILLTPSGRADEVVVPVAMEALPAGTEVDIRIGPPRPLRADAPPIGLEQPVAPLSRDRGSAIVFRVASIGDLPTGHWRYDVSIRSADPAFYFQPASIQLVLDNTLQVEGQLPAFVTSRTRIWPFLFRLRRIDDLAEPSPTQLTFEYQLPGDPGWIVGSVQVAEGVPDSLELKPGDGVISPPAGLEPGPGAVRFRLLLGGKEIRRSASVQGAAPRLEGLDYFQVGRTATSRSRPGRGPWSCPRRYVWIAGSGTAAPPSCPTGSPRSASSWSRSTGSRSSSPGTSPTATNGARGWRRTRSTEMCSAPCPSPKRPPWTSTTSSISRRSTRSSGPRGSVKNTTSRGRSTGIPMAWRNGRRSIASGFRSRATPLCPGGC